MHPLYFKNPGLAGVFYFNTFTFYMKKKQDIHIGFCTAPHGIKGEFSFILYNQDGSVLNNGASVLLMPRTNSSSVPFSGKDYKIKKINFGNKTIVSLEGVDDRNTVEAMVPFDIYYDRENFPDIGSGEYYLNDLLNIEVFDFLSKQVIGNVMDFYDNGAQVILKIKTENDILEILFIDQFVPVVDIENNRIEVYIPEMIE
jgi:16S rRNA processing protein RimM